MRFALLRGFRFLDATKVIIYNIVQYNGAVSAVFVFLFLAERERMDKAFDYGGQQLLVNKVGSDFPEKDGRKAGIKRTL